MKTPNIQLLDIHDRYVEGKINMEQAVKETRQYLPLPDDKLEELLSTLERDNIVPFKKPEVDPEEDDKSCENIVFTLDSKDLYSTVTLDYGNDDEPEDSA